MLALGAACPLGSLSSGGAVGSGGLLAGAVQPEEGAVQAVSGHSDPFGLVSEVQGPPARELSLGFWIHLLVTFSGRWALQSGSIFSLGHSLSPEVGVGVLLSENNRIGLLAWFPAQVSLYDRHLLGFSGQAYQTVGTGNYTQS